MNIMRMKYANDSFLTMTYIVYIILNCKRIRQSQLQIELFTTTNIFCSNISLYFHEI